MKESLYRIDLLGTVITIRTKEDIAYIQQLESKLTEIIKQVKSDLNLEDSLSVAIMSGIYLADENFKLKRQAPVATLSSLDGNKDSFENNSATYTLTQIEKLLDKTLTNWR
jgi:cell division protein ZapA (FtsZ GTPase activity inhibitor)